MISGNKKKEIKSRTNKSKSSAKPEVNIWDSTDHIIRKEYSIAVCYTEKQKVTVFMTISEKTERLLTNTCKTHNREVGTIEMHSPVQYKIPIGNREHMIQCFTKSIPTGFLEKV